MLKRIFLLALALLAGWIAWRWLRRREEDFASTTEQLASLEPLARFVPNATTISTRSVPLEPPVGAPAVGQEEAPDVDTPASDEEAAPPDVEAAMDQADEHAEPAETPGDAATASAEGAIARAAEAAAEPQQPSIPSPTGAPLADAGDGTPGTAAAQAPTADADDLGEIVGYCVRCKTKRVIVDAHAETTESGRRAARGTCPVCGANMFTFLPTE